MTLVPGTRLGPYEITAKLGEGGMGEVYRATDPRLDREVAIKVLPEALADDADRLARFEREAKVLASLDHPSIAGIYEVGEEANPRPRPGTAVPTTSGYESGGEGAPRPRPGTAVPTTAPGSVGRRRVVHYLVMQLVEGPTLAEWIVSGPHGVDDCVAIARQIAAALEEAHEKGIVHRDLKPANVKVDDDGRVKVLDFGLAKAIAADRGPQTAEELANSPTLTQGATMAGMILGTAAYMAPEQAKGKAVDKRADIWAFGVVLYEMLVGERLFEGESLPETLGAIFRQEIDLDRLPPTTPPRLRRLIGRCLERDPKQRLRDIGEARIALSDVGDPESESAAEGAATRPTSRRSGRWLALAAAVAILAALATGLNLGRRAARMEPPDFQPLTFARGFVHSARFAPDGETVIYGAAIEDRPVALYSTRTDSTESRPFGLPGSDIAGLSAGGQMALLLGRHNQGSWLRVGTLAQVALAGGAPREILEEVYGADISPDGKSFAVVIVDGDDQVLQYPIGREIYRSGGWISEPRIAPDGLRVAFVDHRLWGDDLGVVVLAEPGAEASVLSDETQFLQGVAWAPDGDHVWFSGATLSGGGGLWRVEPGARPETMLTTPSLVRVQDVGADGRVLLIADEVRVTLTGRLAGDEAERVYTWWDDDLAETILADGTMYVGHTPSVLVDGEYTLYSRRVGEPPVLLGSGTAAGMTPDGRFVISTSLKGRRTALTMRPIGPGSPRTLDLGDVEVPDGNFQTVSFSADGRRLAFVGTSPGTGRTVWVMDLDDGVPRVASPPGAASAMLSPDGSQVAVADPSRGLYVIASDGGEPLVLAAAPRDDEPLAWTADGKAVLSWDRTLPARIYRNSVTDGTRELLRELVPADPAGILYAILRLSPGGEFYLQRSRRILSAVHLMRPHEPAGLLAALRGEESEPPP